MLTVWVAGWALAEMFVDEKRDDGSVGLVCDLYAAGLVISGWISWGMVGPSRGWGLPLRAW